ncbi:MAG: hypothetical protein WDW38_010458 [Sanguina aurantia]
MSTPPQPRDALSQHRQREGTDLPPGSACNLAALPNHPTAQPRSGSSSSGSSSSRPLHHSQSDCSVQPSRSAPASPTRGTPPLSPAQPPTPREGLKQPHEAGIVTPFLPDPNHPHAIFSGFHTAGSSTPFLHDAVPASHRKFPTLTQLSAPDTAPGIRLPSGSAEQEAGGVNRAGGCGAVTAAGRLSFEHYLPPDYARQEHSISRNA